MKHLEDLSRSEISALIDEWTIGRNAERDRALLKRRLLDGITYERLSEEFEMSVRQISNVIYKRQNKLFEHIK